MKINSVVIIMITIKIKLITLIEEITIIKLFLIFMIKHLIFLKVMRDNSYEIYNKI